MFTSMAAMHAVGWHGKLPTVGDFATRRLDSNFVAVWDDWLSAGLARLRSHDPDGWLQAYLASPTWRFLSLPGFFPAPLHAQAWIGVVMPSVDRVGRYYPLTLAAPLPSVPTYPDVQLALWVWMQRLEDAAIDALQEDWSIDLLETELLRVGLPPQTPSPGLHTGPAPLHSMPTGPAAGGAASAPVSMGSFFAACAAATQPHAGRPPCVWYSEADIASPRMLCSPAMNGSIAELWKG